LTILYILNIILPTSYKHSEDAHSVGYSELWNFIGRLFGKYVLLP